MAAQRSKNSLSSKPRLISRILSPKCGCSTKLTAPNRFDASIPGPCAFTMHGRSVAISPSMPMDLRWCGRSTAVGDFSNADEVRRVYHPEVDRLIKELTGAETVLMFGPALRTDSPDRASDVRQPATAPHVDYSEKMVRHFIRDLAAKRRPSGSASAASC